MKPGEKPQNAKDAVRDLDRAKGGGLKAKEAEQVRGGKSKKSTVPDVPPATPK
jgi:hypothetical protein